MLWDSDNVPSKDYEKSTIINENLSTSREESMEMYENLETMRIHIRHRSNDISCCFMSMIMCLECIVFIQVYVVSNVRRDVVDQKVVAHDAKGLKAVDGLVFVEMWKWEQQNPGKISSTEHGGYL